MVVFSFFFFFVLFFFHSHLWKSKGVHIFNTLQDQCYCENPINENNKQLSSCAHWNVALALYRKSRQFKWRLARMQRTKPFKLLKRDMNAPQIPLWLMQKGSYQNTLSLGGCWLKCYSVCLMQNRILFAYVWVMNTFTWETCFT